MSRRTSSPMSKGVDNNRKPMIKLGRTCFPKHEANDMAADLVNRGYRVEVVEWIAREDVTTAERIAAQDRPTEPVPAWSDVEEVARPERTRA